MKWDIFTEVDAYVVWSTMLKYLSTLDPTQSVYQGQSMSAGGGYFVYGGAGILVSLPALQAVVAEYSQYRYGLEEYTKHGWAGDDVLGKAFRDAGVSFTDIWPFMQGDYPGWLTYLPLNGDSLVDGIAQAWCKPVPTFHHLTPDTVRDLWQAEQDWTAKKDIPDSFLRQRDVFHHYTLPQMARSPRLEWDSDCDQEDPEARSREECQQSCQRRTTCLQYSFEEEGIKCRTRDIPRLGVAKAGYSSGWLTDRMKSFEETMPDCGSEIHWPIAH